MMHRIGQRDAISISLCIVSRESLISKCAEIAAFHVNHDFAIVRDFTAALYQNREDAWALQDSAAESQDTAVALREDGIAAPDTRGAALFCPKPLVSSSFAARFTVFQRLRPK